MFINNINSIYPPGARWRTFNQRAGNFRAEPMNQPDGSRSSGAGVRGSDRSSDRDEGVCGGRYFSFILRHTLGHTFVYI